MLDLNKLKNEEVVNVTHKNCPDGVFSSVVVYKWCMENDIKSIEIFQHQYGETLPDLDMFIGKVVVLTDYTFPKDYLNAMLGVAKYVYVIDHHKSAQEALVDFEHSTFDMSHSGAVLTWKEFYPNTEVPTVLKYIEDRDLWLWKLQESKEFSAGLRLLDISNILSTMDYNKILSDDFIDGCVKEGYTVLAYQEQQIERKTDNVINNKLLHFEIDGVSMPCINNTDLISEVGNELAKGNGSNASVQYFITDENIVFSLRSVGDTDVAKIAKKFLGGGHKNAAGFSIPLQLFDFNSFIKTKKLKPEDYYVDFISSKLHELNEESGVELVLDSILESGDFVFMLKEDFGSTEHFNIHHDIYQSIKFGTYAISDIKEFISNMSEAYKNIANDIIGKMKV